MLGQHGQGVRCPQGVGGAGIFSQRESGSPPEGEEGTGVGDGLGIFFC